MLYLIFAGHNYYPSGAKDLQKIVRDDKEEAHRLAKYYINNKEPLARELDWYEVVEVNEETLERKPSIRGNHYGILDPL